MDFRPQWKYFSGWKTHLQRKTGRWLWVVHFVFNWWQNSEIIKWILLNIQGIVKTYWSGIHHKVNMKGKTIYRPYLLTLQSMEMSWSFLQIIHMRRMPGLMHSNRQGKVQGLGNTQRNVVWLHHHHGWREIQGHCQKELIQSQAHLEATQLGHHQIQPHPRALLALLVYTLR